MTSRTLLLAAAALTFACGAYTPEPEQAFQLELEGAVKASSQKAETDFALPVATCSAMDARVFVGARFQGCFDVGFVELREWRGRGFGTGERLTGFDLTSSGTHVVSPDLGGAVPESEHLQTASLASRELPLASYEGGDLSSSVETSAVAAVARCGKAGVDLVVPFGVRFDDLDRYRFPCAGTLRDAAVLSDGSVLAAGDEGVALVHPDDAPNPKGYGQCVVAQPMEQARVIARGANALVVGGCSTALCTLGGAAEAFVNGEFKGAANIARSRVGTVELLRPDRWLLVGAADSFDRDVVVELRNGDLSAPTEQTLIGLQAVPQTVAKLQDGSIAFVSWSRIDAHFYRVTVNATTEAISLTDLGAGPAAPQYSLRVSTSPDGSAFVWGSDDICDRHLRLTAESGDRALLKDCAAASTFVGGALVTAVFGSLPGDLLGQDRPPAAIVWNDLQTGAELHRVPALGAFLSARFEVGGDALLVTSERAVEIFGVDGERRAVLSGVPFSGAPPSSKFVTDGKGQLFGAAGNELIRVRTGDSQLHSKPSRCFRFSCGGANVDLGADPKNCGACGNDCGEKSCVAGSCVGG